MPEESASTPAEAPAAEEATAKENSSGKENGAGDGEPKTEGEIKKCDRPNKEEFEAKVQTLNDEIAVLNNKLSAIDVNIQKTKQSGGGQMDELSQARAQMKTLRDQKDKIMRERQEVLDKRNAAKESLDKKMTTARSVRSELKYTSLEDIEKQITDLEYRQQMTSMTLAAEKKLLKEIDTLKQSKKAVAQLSQHTEAIGAERDAQKGINELLTEKSKELDAVKKQIEDQRVVLEGLNGENNERKSALPALFKEKDAIRADKTAKVEEIKKMRTDYRNAENDFRAYQREVRRLRKEEREAQEVERKKEQEERKKAWEAEEAKKVPYEEEMGLCDYLVNYLETSFVNTPEDGGDVAKKEEKTVGEFEGFALVGKAARRKFDETDDFCNLGLGKKKGRGNKKGGASKGGASKLVLAVDTFEHFSMIGVDAPTTREGMPAVVEAIKKRKEYYQNLPRGEVKSIREKQLEESEKRSRAERDERRARDGEAEKPAPKPKEEKPAKKEKAPVEYNALEAAGSDAAFPGLPGAPAKKAAAAPAADADAEES